MDDIARSSASAVREKVESASTHAVGRTQLLRPLDGSELPLNGCSRRVKGLVQIVSSSRGSLPFESWRLYRFPSKSRFTLTRSRRSSRSSHRAVEARIGEPKPSRSLQRRRWPGSGTTSSQGE